MRVKIGELNKRIQLIKNDFIVNDNGYEEEVETVVVEVWSKVQNMSGTEMFKANTDYSKVTTRFLIRYREDLTTDNSIKFNGKKYNILYLNNYNYSNDFLEIIGELIQ